MGRHSYLHPHLPVDELERRYRAAKEPHERSWWHLLWLLAQGRTATELAEVTGYSRYWIGQIAKRFNQHGPSGRRHMGHRCALAPALNSAKRRQMPATVRIISKGCLILPVMPLVPSSPPYTLTFVHLLLGPRTLCVTRASQASNSNESESSE